MVDLGEHAAPEDPQTSAAGWACWGEGGGLEEGPQRIPYCGGVKSAHWAEVQQDVLEAGGGSHTADPVAPRLCEGEEDEDEGVVSVGPSANQLTLEVVSPAFHFLERDHY